MFTQANKLCLRYKVHANKIFHCQCTIDVLCQKSRMPTNELTTVLKLYQCYTPKPAKGHCVSAKTRKTFHFTARRYVSAVFALVMCPSVCPSVRHRPVLYRKDRTRTTQAGFWRRGVLPPVTRCVIRKFVYLPRLDMPSRTLSQTSDLENFATTSRPRCEQNSSSSSTVDDTYTTVDELWVFTTSRSIVTFQIHYIDLLWIC